MTSTAGFFLLQAAGGGTSPLIQLGFEFALIFGLAYFMFLRPQQQQRKRHEEALRQIKKGDEIVTAGGIIGQVVHVRETLKDGAPQKSMDDQVTIRSGESRLIVERGRIAKIVGAGTRAESTATTAT